jgi:hypothetical protein
MMVYDINESKFETREEASRDAEELYTVSQMTQQYGAKRADRRPLHFKLIV